MALTRAQIQTAFQNSLGRAANTNEENSFFSVSQSGALTDAQVFQTISNSREADIISDPVVRFYQAAFGRVPDAPGLDNWQDFIRGNGPTEATYIQVATLFTQQPEFTARFGSDAGVTAGYVQALYTTILGRSASAAEIDGYVSGAAGYTTRGGVLYAISQSQEAFDISNNAVNGFLNNAAQGNAVYQGTLFTPANGEANIPGAPVNNLTTGVDNFVGTGSNDVVNGFIDTTAGSTTSTFTVADTINGGAGTDSLNVLLTGTGGATAVPLANVTNVENFFIRNLAAGAATFNAAAVTGEQQVWNDRSTAAVEVTGLGTGATIGVRGDGNTTTSATTFNYASGTDAVTIAIDGGTKGAAAISRTGTGAAAVTINSTGAANTVGVIDLDNTAAAVGSIKSVTINATTGLTAQLAAGDFAANAALKLTGAGAIALQGATLAANITTIDASGTTGGVNVRSSNAADITFTGGSGNDTLRLDGTLTGADTINGGAGTDTVRITGGDYSLATNATLQGLNKLVSVEQVRFDGAGVTLDGNTLQNSDITKLIFRTTGADTINNAGTRTYAFGEDNAGAATFNAKAGTTTLNLEIIGDDDNAVTAGTVTANGQSTVNISLTGEVGQANSFAQLNAAGNTTVNVTGAGDFAINGLAPVAGGTFANTTDAGIIVNATGLNGKFTVVGSNAVDTITVGSGGSTVTGGAGGDNITLGAGADTVVYTTLTHSLAAAPDTVTGFTAGTDKFGVNTAPTTVFQGAAFTAAGTGTLATDINAALTAGGQTALGANQAAVVTVTGTGAGTYLVINNATAGYDAAADAVVKLAGLSGTLATTDFAVVGP